MITYLLNTLVDSIKTSLINKLGLDPSTEVDLDDFPQLIDDIPILDSVEELTVTQNGTYTGTEGVTYNPVNVNLPLGSKSVTANGTYTASDDSLQGYSSVTVDIDDTDLYRDTTDSTYESVKTLSNCGAFPMLSLTAEINAVQDLHGYDSPWAGGAGKNLFNKPNLVMNKAIPLGTTIYGQIFGVTASFKLYGYDENDNEYEVIPLSINKNSTTTTRAYTRLEIPQSALNALGNGNLMVSLSDFTQFEPYSNICPISGWDSIDVSRCGKNLLPTGRGYDFLYNADAGTVLDVDTDTPDWTDDGNGEFSVTLGVWQRCGLLSVQLPIGKTVYVRIKIVSGSPSVTTYTLDADYRVIRKFSNYNPASDGLDYNTQIQLAENEHYVGVAIIGHNKKVIIRNPHIVLNTDEPYEPYNGQTYTTALSTTCYGGSKDIKGNERFTHGHIASYNGETLPGAWISDRDEYAEGTTPTIGAEVVYELATPTTATSDAIDLTLAEGVNNLWANSGDVGDARYFRKVEL